VLWLITQIWFWIIVALLLGVLAGWWFQARPLRLAADAIEAGSAGRSTVSR
jgi:Na+/H+-dicarboxylate symporter